MNEAATTNKTNGHRRRSGASELAQVVMWIGRNLPECRSLNVAQIQARVKADTGIDVTTKLIKVCAAEHGLIMTKKRRAAKTSVQYLASAVLDIAGSLGHGFPADLKVAVEAIANRRGMP